MKAALRFFIMTEHQKNYEMDMCSSPILPKLLQFAICLTFAMRKLKARLADVPVLQ